jgi:hypothetical protein
MALRVQGITTPERAATALGVTRDAAAGRLRDLVAAELAAERSGRVAGFALTPAGSEAVEQLLAVEGLRSSVELKDGYDRFLLLNERVLRVSSDWQVRRDGGVETPNDHSDASYDQSVIDRLVELHNRAKTAVGKIASSAERFQPYGARLDSCVERLLAGDTTAFTAPLADSYHTVWFELHQDLLLTLGLARES